MAKDPDLEKLQDDIRGMKQVMDLGASSFKQIYNAQNFRFLFLFSSIAAVIIPILFALLQFLNIAGETTGQWILGITIGLCWLFLFGYKSYITQKAAKELGLVLNWLGLFKEQMTSRIWLAVVPTLLILTLLPFKLETAWTINTILAYGGIVLGLIMNLIGVIISEREYLFCGFWMLGTGALFFFILTWPAHIVGGLILAPACFLFYITATVTKRG